MAIPMAILMPTLVASKLRSFSYGYSDGHPDAYFGGF